MNKAHEIREGDTVRSFDFPDTSKTLHGINANYIEGVVVAIDTKRFSWECYKIKTTKAVHSGNESPHFAEFYYPPVNGSKRMFSNKPTDFVEKI